MSDAKPLAEQLAECEQWCAARPEKEYLAVAMKGLRILPEQHTELVKPLPGQEPRVDGWLLRFVVIGVGSWSLLAVVFFAGAGAIFVSAYPLFQDAGHPVLYTTLLSIPSVAVLFYLPLRNLLLGYELVFGDEELVVRRLRFGRIEKEWRLPIVAETRVGLAYRGARARRRRKHGAKFAQLSVVVGCGEAEIVFGDDLDHAERARLAILIDHHFNGLA